MINVIGFALTVGMYKCCNLLKKIPLVKKIPPMLMTGMLIIILLKLIHINYNIYNQSACYVTFLLGPATIALAYPMVKNFKVLTENKRALYFGLVFSTVIALVTTYLTAKIFGADFNVLLSMIPKSVTTPIAIEISKSIGGIPELTACIVIMTGLVGGLTAHRVLKFLKIKSDIAIGISIGASSHVLGTSRCIEKDKQKQVAICTIALIIVGILTTILSPIFVNFLKY